ncbi:zinc finger protein 233-like isoform X2 [Diabrotica virgifera virgifera]|uniref:C2H2-type domain-containing protein n=1 Tax=Diabrotica virgifera virgifera TaxID=50390 RepID=A0ABM5KIF6_DIAVI|nr:zinc finger protein 233-like isoform X2 [Diabrotica virgifera virgifera]
MEVKQEVGEEACKIEIDTDVNEAVLNSFKLEIKEEQEPKRETIQGDTFDYVDLKNINIPMKIEIGQDEHKLLSLEQKQTIEKGFPQEENTLESRKTIDIHSWNERQPMSQPAEGKSFKCEICFKLFAKKKRLNEHIRIHSTEKLYKCDICLKQFRAAASVIRHMRSHTGEKPYKCEICFKQFAQKCQLKPHLLTHTGEKPYQCEICLNQFSQPCALNHI